MAEDGNYRQVRIGIGVFKLFSLVLLSGTELSVADDGNYRQVHIDLGFLKLF